MTDTRGVVGVGGVRQAEEDAQAELEEAEAEVPSHSTIAATPTSQLSSVVRGGSVK